MGHLIETRGPVATIPAEAAAGFGYLHVRLRQLIEEARGQVALPLPVRAPIGGEIDFRASARARQPNMGEPALLLEPGTTLIIQCPLAGKQPFLPAGQEHGVELQYLGRM